jgi:hypothetical protein
VEASLAGRADGTRTKGPHPECCGVGEAGRGKEELRVQAALRRSLAVVAPAVHEREEARVEEEAQAQNEGRRALGTRGQ